MCHSELTPQGYRMIAVYGAVDAGLGQEIVDFWQRNRAIADPREAQRRSAEVVFTVRDSTGCLVGVSTVYEAKIQGDRRYFFYRMFIQPRDRVPGLMRRVVLATRDYLRDLRLPGKPRGIVIVAENPKLTGRGMRRQFRRYGWQLLGRTPRGQDVWKSDF